MRATRPRRASRARARLPTDFISAVHFIDNCGWLGCRESRMVIASVNISADANQYTVRQPYCAPTMPLNVRASRTPMSSPLNTVPTMRPRSFGGARCAASGTTTCTVAAAPPTKKQARLNHNTFDAVAARAQATASATSSAEIKPRRSYLSPSGTKNSIPRPVPT
jgi:hypothetical protein